MKTKTNLRSHQVKTLLGRHAGLVIAIIIPLAIQTLRAQDCQHFYGRSTPFGSGDRLLKATINPCDAGSPNDVELLVFYSTNQQQINSHLDSNNPISRATARYVGTTSGRYEYEFIFPHTTHRKPNSSDVHPVKIPDAAKVYVRLMKRTKTHPGVREDLDDIYSFKMPHKMTIANTGDSYAAGEGAPVKVGGPSSGWTDAQRWTDGNSFTETDIECHRSRVSGQTLSVIDLIDGHPEVAVDFLNVACSGAQIENLSSDKPGDRQISTPHHIRVPFQFTLINNWLSARQYPRLDILMINIGGNNLGFADIVFDFLIVPFMDFSVDTEAKEMVEDGISELPRMYDTLNEIIHVEFALLPAVCKTVIISTIPSPCIGPSGFCDAEQEAIHNLMVLPWNSKIRAAADRNGWDTIEMQEAAGNHGMCADDTSRYYNKSLFESLSVQGDIFGICHPNRRGTDGMYHIKWNQVWNSKLASIRAIWDSGRLLNEDGRAQLETDFQKTQVNERMQFSKRLNVSRAATLARVKALNTKHGSVLANRKQIASDYKKTVLRSPPPHVSVPKFPVPHKYLDHKLSGDYP